MAAGLHAISPLDGRYREKASPLGAYFSEFALIRARVEVEVRYFVFLSGRGIGFPLSPEYLPQLSDIYNQFSESDALRVKEIERRTRHDVKAVEYFLRERLENLGLADAISWIHFALTSEDVNNLSYRLLLQRFLSEVFWPELQDILAKLESLVGAYGSTPILARTHGQPAVPTTFGKELAVFNGRLLHQLKSAQEIQLRGKLSGAVGNWNAHQAAMPEVDWPAFSADFIEGLGLVQVLLTTQIAPPEDLIEVFHAVLRVNGILLDLNQDIWRYISDGWLRLKVGEGQVGSSTMPQKVNPIDFENSEGNLAIANALLEALARKLPVSRLQRDLSESTMMRNIGAAFGHTFLALKSLEAGLDKIALDPEAVADALDENWNILAEAAQTLARVEGRPDAYERVAEKVKARRLDARSWIELVDSLELSDEAAERLRRLTPGTYTGIAAELARRGAAQNQAAK